MYLLEDKSLRLLHSNEQILQRSKHIDTVYITLGSNITGSS